MREKGLALLLVVVLAAGSLLPVNAMEVKGEVPGNDIGQETGLPDEEEKDPEESDPSEAMEAEEEQVPDLGNVEETEETDKKDESSLEQEETQTEEESGESSEDATGDTGDTDISGSESEDVVLPGWKIDQTQVTLQPGESTYFTVSDVNEEDGKPEISINNASGITVSEITGEATEDISVPAGSSFRYEVTATLPGDYVISVKVQDSIKEISVHVEEQELLEEGLSKAEGIKPSVPAPTNNTAIEGDTKAAEPGWSEDGLYYTNENGELSKGITEIDGVLYYFDESTGELCQEGKWITKDENRYFCNAEGVLYQDQFIKFGETYYYMGSDGSVQKGLVTAGDGKKYYADPESGEITKSSWVKADGKEYFADSTGALYQDQFIKFGTTYYYMGSDGSVQKGVVKASDGQYYYTDPDDGILQKEVGWLDVEGKRYFADGTGKLYSNQFIKFGDTYYYMGVDASVQKGVIKASDGQYYYTDPDDGVLQKEAGWLDVEGKRYFADGTGKLYSNQFIKFGDTCYYMGADASVQKGIVKAADGQYYYTDPDDGILQKEAGWLDVEGKRYFADGTGKLYSNQFIKFGDIYYYCGSEAAIIIDEDYPVNGVLYTFNEEGIMVKEGGWGSYNGNKYYKNPTTGFPYTGWVTFGTTWYYADANGLMVKGWQYISGKYYYFYPDTYIMARSTVIDGYAIGADGVSIDKAWKDKIEEIKKYEGYPYAYGGNTPSGWDCSGFVQWIYKNILGVSLPRTTYYQAQQGTAISIYNMDLWRPGDLVFFGSGSVSHVGIYLGDGLMIHALGTKYGTRIDDVVWYDNWDHSVRLTAVKRII